MKLAKAYKLENALNSTLEQIPGAVALLDAKIRYFYHNGLFKEEWGYLFEGTALVDSQLLSDNSTTPQDETIYFLSKEDSDLALVSKEEYHSFLLQSMKTITK